MTLHLDARRRAMLAEMGVRVWLPAPKEVPVVVDAGAQAVQAAQAEPLAPIRTAPARFAGAPVPDAAASTAAEIAEQQAEREAPPVVQPMAAAPQPRGTPPQPMTASTEPEALPRAPHQDTAGAPALSLTRLNWPALQQAAASCTACTLHSGRQHSVWDASAASEPDGLPRWLFVLDPPGTAENATGQPLQGEAGTLLVNMAAAIRLQPAQVLRSHATRCAPSGRPATLPEVAQCAAFLRREIALLRPQVVVALGRNAAWSLLQRTEPLGQLRGQLHHIAVPEAEADLQPLLAPVPVIVSYPLDYLLRNPPAKARAWEDLCLAASHVAA
ncbi:MAG: uracil-DNA glycosylase [Brachymonas denitrificans]|uniref:uracil-DNA glycosylase n=1 Tax=Brachymonas denitrificans TaxID=28220 RepID=UPI00352E0203